MDEIVILFRDYLYIKVIQLINLVRAQVTNVQAI